MARREWFRISDVGTDPGIGTISMNGFHSARAALIGLLCLILGACSQTATSTYGGNLGQDARIEKQREAKKLAARIRAKKIRAAEKKKHALARKARREARKNRQAKSGKRNKKAASIQTSTNSKSKKRSTKKVAKATSSKRNASRSKKRKNRYASYKGKMAGLSVNKPWKCVPAQLKSVINDVRRQFGAVTINSTHRTKRRNRMVGGRSRSYHLRCQAIDFVVKGRTKGLVAYLARHPKVGGYKRYSHSGHYHIDTGPKRTW